MGRKNKNNMIENIVTVALMIVVFWYIFKEDQDV
jgi:hypothetical protein